MNDQRKTKAQLIRELEQANSRIDNLKHAETVLHSKEKKSRKIQALGRIGTWEYDVKTQAIEWSEQTYVLYERDPKKGPPTYEEEATYYSPEQIAILYEYARRAIEEGEEFEYDLQAELPSGRKIDFAATMRPIKNEDGQTIKLFGTVQDITERKQAENQLRVEKEFTSALIDKLSVGLAAIDENGHQTLVNEALCSITGFSEEELLGQAPPFSYWAEEGMPEIEKVFQKALAGEEGEYELTFKRKSGERFIALVAPRMLTTADGKTQFLATVKDITERKRAEEVWHRYAAIVNTSSDLLTLINRDYEYEAVNDAYCRASGKSRDEIVGRKVADIWGQEVFENVIETNLSRCFQGEKVQYEAWFSFSPPAKRYFDVTYYPYFDTEGKVTHAIVATRDITERKQVEEALRESEERYRGLFDNAPIGIGLTTFDGQRIDANKELCRQYGYTKKELMKIRSPGLYANSSDRESMLQQVRKEGGVFLSEFKNIRKDGSQIITRYSAVPITIGEQEVLLSMTEDITDRKEAEEELLTLRLGVQRSKEVIFMTDVEGIITYVNPAFEKTYGYASEEAVGQTPRILKSGEHSPADYENFWDTILAKEVVVSEMINKTKDGRLLHMAISANPIVDEKDTIVGFLAIQQDITERKQSQEERENLIKDLEQKNVEMERFNYTVSHDLKSPLITIKGFTDLLEKELVKAKKQDAALGAIGYINKAVDKMHLLLDDLLELSRVGRLVNPPGEFALGPLLDEVIEQLSGPIENGKVRIVIDPDLPTLSADRSRIAQVLQNLIENGVKFMGDQKSPEITIGSREEEGEQVIYVRDNGIGIDPEHHNRIFDLFQQLAPSNDGSGVGLTMVKRIIELHGGRIWVESEGAGKVTEFCFTLPGPTLGSEKAEA